MRPPGFRTRPIETRFPGKEHDMNEKSWKLRDIIMMGILGVLFAVIYMAVVYVGLAISTAVAPLGLSDLAFEPI